MAFVWLPAVVTDGLCEDFTVYETVRMPLHGTDDVEHMKSIQAT